MNELIAFLKARPVITPPKRFDECVYVALYSTVGQSIPQPSKLGNPLTETLEAYRAHAEALDGMQRNLGEVFFYDYGVAVFWGFTEEEERIVLRDLKRFEEDALSPDDIETEEFVFHYNSSYRPRVYNDVIVRYLVNPFCCCCFFFFFFGKECGSWPL
jgi:uncharacterized Rmd1/YagE family protein